MLNYNQTLDFYKFCDILYQEWTLGHLEDDKILQKLFELNCSHEPYFTLKNGNNPLYVLLTNPGSGMDFQHTDHHKEVNYYKFQEILGTIYTSEAFSNEKGGPSPQKQECGCLSLQSSLHSHTHAFLKAHGLNPCKTEKATIIDGAQTINL
jgi:hypothetical protein